MMDVYVYMGSTNFAITVAASKDEGVEFEFVKTGWRGGYPGVS